MKTTPAELDYIEQHYNHAFYLPDHKRCVCVTDFIADLREQAAKIEKQEDRLTKVRDLVHHCCRILLERIDELEAINQPVLTRDSATS